MIRGQDVGRALTTLGYTPKKAARIVRKVLESAIANAENNFGADIDELKISKIFVNDAPTYRRYRARARGRGAKILKRHSHITVRVADGSDN